MPFHSTDVLVLQCIFHCERQEKGASLRNIISYGDYINHAIPEWKEIGTATGKLMGAGLIIMEDKHFCTAPAFRQWYEKKFRGKKSIAIQKEATEILKFLQENFPTVHENPLTGISQADYNQALEQYTNPASRG